MARIRKIPKAKPKPRADDKPIEGKSRFEDRRPSTAALLLVLGCLVWSVWPVLVSIEDRWSHDPRYSHGYLVPLISIGLLWSRRAQLASQISKPTTWGLVFVAFGAAIQLAGGYLQHDFVSGVAILPYLVGVCLLVGGWRMLKCAGPPIAFLGFMIPLPWRAENALGPLLQFLATTASTYILQTLGFMAFAEGFVIQLNDARIGVVEACSGLSMIMTFLALSTALAMVVSRPLLDKLILVATSIPVALMANITRITATGILHETIGDRAADAFYHDLAGWLMMPLALAMYGIEIWLLSQIFIETKREAIPALELAGSGRRSSVAAVGTKR